ncbi:N-acyl amino acid synthase FeeM domain-containing protein [Ramlibacter sp. MMS24-I3-19]|uniref:N-acyl amino acid synthase FeeM domain-containing protein n=1 Tax=Ramlibacter sp. MMS24-I3-19 TaxID=3416606 RepID=UPI003D093D3A
MGIVLGFELGGELIGTIRIVPIGYGLTLTEQLLPGAGPAAPEPGEGDWEVGRLVLAPARRSDVEALRQCLHAAVVYGLEHAHVRHLYATCTHVLSRLYRRFGFTAFARDVPLPGTSKVYTMIGGAARPVARALAGQPAHQAH